LLLKISLSAEILIGGGCYGAAADKRIAAKIAGSKGNVYEGD
jgi:hypothetical protein